ncbi:MAG: methyltransferase domain-containing protein [Nitriliruptorales bacterium]|nr:methyltransferase domain-containing protein [Nitriliruptorales bacterium]
MTSTEAPTDDEGYVERDLSPDELQLAFHEFECQTYDERFGISADEHTARQAAHEAQRLLGREVFDRVLDVGCGTGYLGLGLAAEGQARNVHLCDLSPGMLDRARENAESLGVDADFTRATAAELPFEDDSFDAVVTRGVLHHLHDVPAALAEWRRVVKPGGPVLALSEPTPWADTVGGATARAVLGSLSAARRIADRLGRPLSQHSEEEQRTHEFWDLVAMAANLHTFHPDELRRLGEQAGFRTTTVRGCGLLSIQWAASWYVLVGELPGLAASQRGKKLSGRVFGALRRFDGAVTERLLPDARLLTVQAVFRD